MARTFKDMLLQIARDFDVNVLDEFISHFESSIGRMEQRIDKEHGSLTPDQFEDPRDIDEYRMHLEDEAYLASQVRELGYELCIVGLYKHVELHTKRVVERNFTDITGKDASRIDVLKQKLPFDIAALPEFRSFDELRLINNAIKHQGRVSKDLASKFPAWKEGENLSGLKDAYNRLLPLVRQYLEAFVIKAFANSQKL